MPDTPLKDQVAIISGALGDIGCAIALQLARLGADVSLGDLAPPEAAAPLLAELRDLGRRARYDRVDVTDADGVNAWVTATERDLGVPTRIIPSAATVTIVDALRITPDQWSRELAVNLTGSFLLAQAGARRMLAAGKRGRIVFVGSWAAHVPHPHLPAYSVSKAGLRMLCQCMALELAPAGILVNEIAPGYVDAGLSAAVFREQPGAREDSQQRVPTGQLMTAEDVAAQVGYLCSDASPHTTGSVLLMDGGLSLGHTRRTAAADRERPR
jgi:NAD(P)-dependent dehydrogenase (short-subunit alcohol dehydrogenase family)